MFQELLYTLIGSWGRAVIEWALANPVQVGLACGAWLIIIGASKLQLKWIKDRTESLMLTTASGFLEVNPRLPVDKLFDQVYPVWSEMVRKTALFIPHRWEVWPVPATPERVAGRLDFTPEWLGQHLLANGVEVHGVKPKKEKS
jgi:hypothetical protein